MSNRIDKLFNDKLADHSVAPSSNAWARVEANLSKKNKAIIWFRWAAALLIPVLLVGYMIWIKNNTDASTDLAVESSAKTRKTTPTVIENKQTHQTNDTLEKDTKLSKSLTTTNIKNLSKETVSSEQKSVINPYGQSTAPSEKSIPFAAPNQTATTMPDNTIDLKLPTQNINIPINELTPANQATTQNINAPKNEKPIVIEYAIESPVMETEKAITLTIELKEKKGFQKVIDFVRDSQNGEGPFATIREAKDDLFAFNFKKDKTKHK